MKLKVVVAAIIAIIAVAGIAAVVLSDDEGTETGTLVTLNGWTWTYEGDKVTKVTGNGTTIRASDWPDGIKKIEGRVFRQPANLTSVEIPEGVTTLVSGFSYAKTIRSVTLPSTLTYIGSSAFTSCEALESIVIPSGVTRLNDTTFWNCYALRSVSLPSTMTWIGDSVFLHCDKLTSISLPASLEHFGAAFQEHTNLTSISVPSSNPNFIVDNGVLYSKDKTQLFLVAGNKTGTFNAPSTVTKLGNYAFAGSGVSAVNLPDAVDTIPLGAFYKCTSLTSFTVPKSVTEIGFSAFASSGLRSVSIPDGVTHIRQAAFDSTKLTSIVIPDSVILIVGGIFQGCTDLNSVTLSKNLTVIQSGTFRECTSLTSIDIPDKVERIEATAFDGCTSLEYAIVPEHTVIEAGAFPAATQIIPKLDFSTYPTADMIIRQVSGMKYEFSTTTAGHAVWDIGGMSYEGSTVTHTFDHETVCKVLLTIYDENGKITHKTERVFNISDQPPVDPEQTGNENLSLWYLGGAAAVVIGVIALGAFALGARNRTLLIIGIAAVIIGFILLAAGWLL